MYQGPNNHQSYPPHPGGWGRPPSYPYPPPPSYRLELSPEDKERKAIRRTANFIAIGLLGIVVVPVVLEVILLIIAMLAGNQDLMSMLTSLTDSDNLLFLNFILTVPSFTIPFIISAKASKHTMGEVLSSKKFSPVLGIGAVMATLGLGMIGNYATNILNYTLSLLGLESQYSGVSVPEGPFGPIIYIVTVAFVPALIEEFAFRGVVYGMLQKYGKAFAIVISAAFFGLMHMNMVQMPFAFIVGLGLGMCVALTGSIWPAVIAHFLNNLFSVLLDLSGQYLSDTNYDIVSSAYMAVMLIVGIIGLAIILRQKSDFCVTSPGATRLSVKNKITAFMSAPAVIVATIILCLMLLIQTIPVDLSSITS